ncbi:hypothetical protein B484DRAFT_450210 [Ochromonadaceae sp. CCMP2298]|nr:hypothetical protein B484DRAFT_450210 [Ochromonadaceae sp. CCMP2298]
MLGAIGQIEGDKGGKGDTGDVLLVRTLKQQGRRLPSKSQTALLAMQGSTAQGSPLFAAGTLEGIEDTLRVGFLDYCPEMKLFFPSMHSPHCFGANPNPLECFRYLCQAGMGCGRAVGAVDGGGKGKAGKKKGGQGQGGQEVSFVDKKWRVTISIQAQLL